MLRIVKPKTKRAKRILEKRAPKFVSAASLDFSFEICFRASSVVRFYFSSVSRIDHWPHKSLGHLYRGFICGN